MHTQLLIVFLMAIVPLTVFAAEAELPNRVRIEFDSNDLASYPDVKTKKFYFGKSTTVQINDARAAKAEIHTRGQACLWAPRRCFSVKIRKKSEKMAIHKSDGSVSYTTRRFNLVSMWQDLAYSRSMIGYDFYRRAGLFLPRSHFTELVINGVSQGLYLIVEKPTRKMKKKMNAAFVLRRSYVADSTAANLKHYLRKRTFFGHTVKEYDQKKATITNKKTGEKKIVGEADFLRAYQEIAKAPRRIAGKRLRGQALYAYYKSRFDIDGYLRWLSINNLLRNGDYEDEIFFYNVNVKKTAGDIYFKVMAWDPDGLFSPPHFGPNNTLLNRWNRNKSMLYSLETALDRRINFDRFMYQKYLQILAEVVNDTFSEDNVTKIFSSLRVRISPYIAQPHILEPSARDDDRFGKSYTEEYIHRMLKTREKAIKDRRQKILKRLKKQLRRN